MISLAMRMEKQFSQFAQRPFLQSWNDFSSLTAMALLESTALIFYCIGSFDAFKTHFLVWCAHVEKVLACSTSTSENFTYRIILNYCIFCAKLMCTAPQRTAIFGWAIAATLLKAFEYRK